MEHCRKTLASMLRGIYSALNDNLSFGLNWVNLPSSWQCWTHKGFVFSGILLSFRYCLGWGGGGVASFSTNPTGSTSFVALPQNHC